MEFGFYNMDCMKGMKQFPDKFFDLAIVDPPYFSGPEKRKYYGRSVSKTGVKRKNYERGQNWKVPKRTYFKELARVSKNQIIWGINYFDINLKGSGRIVWDKCNEGSSFSDCEIAYCSLQDSVRIFRFMWNGMMQGKSVNEGWIQQGNKNLNEYRIHPTQKPVALYNWILSKYAKPGDIILDTHVGSASSLIACHQHHLKYVGFELDPEYYKKAKGRLEAETQQMDIYDVFDFASTRIK